LAIRRELKLLIEMCVVVAQSGENQVRILQRLCACFVGFLYVNVLPITGKHDDAHISAAKRLRVSLDMEINYTGSLYDHFQGLTISIKLQHS
jgi:hypothetical protein